MAKVFVDGSAGTTGLRIRERLADRADIELVVLPDELRKDPAARAEALDGADIAFLCLPDAAAIEAVGLLSSPDTVIIDTSTAHRTAEGWAYGFPELEGYRERIAASKRIANPGCHASGFISLVEPLVRAGLIAPDALLSSFSLTGYTGGGKSMVAQYEADERDAALDSPRVYGTGQKHKHLPEMAKVCGLASAPVFSPIVADFPCGMEVVVPLHASQVAGTIDDIKAVYQHYYNDRGGLVRFAEPEDPTFLASNAFAGRDDLQVCVFGCDERLTLVSRFDNLGKGASGAAIQNMNIVLGVDEKLGLSC